MSISSAATKSPAGRLVRVAVVGAGTWGINHVRAFSRLTGCQLATVCDLSAKHRSRAAELAPGVHLTDKYDDVLADPTIDAVVLATPAIQHAAQAEAALAQGKHVLCEKPMALTVEDAEALHRRAQASGRVFLVGHLMLYHAAVLRLRQLIESGHIGEVHYLYALRVNLGRLRADENAMWSLGPHDLSIILYLLDRMPTSVSARGQSYLQPGIEDVVFVNLAFSDGTRPNQMAQVQVSWLDPHKERRLTVVGSQRMVEFDDSHPTEKLRIYDKGFDTKTDAPPAFTQYGEYLTVRQGDVHIPHLDLPEPLQVQSRHFIDCIAHPETHRPRTGSGEGLRVIRVLAAAQQSLRLGGVPVEITAG